MATIKIISNPYKKEVQYRQWISGESGWQNIDVQSTPNSKLISKSLVKGFFPFKAKQIVELIAEEYGVDGESITIVFEGSDDEYQELVHVCKLNMTDYEILPERSEYGLANARDILPEVKKLFKEMSPLIHQCVTDTEKIERDLTRFSDASSDVVPICVLGNYSAGKSTFISALIGSEILPSGTEPITSKIYKIARSQYSDRAQIQCKYYEYNMSVFFTDRDFRVVEGMIGNPLADALTQALQDMNDDSIAIRMNKALAVINEFEDVDGESHISDLIEVEIPFVKGVLAQSQHPFVIFDTPGSNSASNARHLKVLKEAMSNMTNGLPIFLCTAETLDSTDNENLYRIIEELDELDSRFTMIVVNKADNAGVQRRGTTEQEQNRILRQAIPRNLYAGGLFYISSILGLGSKTDGVFIDEVYEDIYDAQQPRYSNPSNKFYRSLYQYNIMPDQIKKRSEKLASEQEDLVYANSGLFTVESEIETFAGKYAAYNKCFQSQLFLGKVIQTTERIIEADKTVSEEIRQNIKSKLEKDKKDLIEILEDEAAASKDKCETNYPEYMHEPLEKSEGMFSDSELRAKEKEFTSAQEAKHKYEETEQEEKKAWEDIGGNLKANIKGLLKNGKVSESKTTAGDFSNDVDDAIKMSGDKFATRKVVDKDTSNDLSEGMFSNSELRAEETEFTTAEEAEQKNEETEQEEKKAWEDIGENLKANIKGLLHNGKVSVLKTTAGDFSNDISNAIKKSRDKFATRKVVDKDTSNDLIEYTRDMYTKRSKEVYDNLSDASKAYWTSKMEELRVLLAMIINGSEVLTDERRSSLNKLILEYRELVLDERAAEELFERENFERAIHIGKQTILLSDHLNIEKIVKTYNDNIKIDANKYYNSIAECHKECVQKWIRNLLDEIIENIVEYSPELSRQARQIQSMTKQIEALKDRQMRLKAYTEQLVSMMDWKYRDTEQ